MRTSQRRPRIVAATGILTALTGLGLATVTVAPSEAAPAPDLTRTSVPTADPGSGAAAASARAVGALADHGRDVLSSPGTDFRPGSTLLDDDGSSHVRMDRTYHGLRVLGGDIVVHQDAAGGWAGVSQTLAEPLTLSTQPTLTPTAATSAATAPAQALADITGLRAGDSPVLVIDALGHAPRLAWAVTTAGTRSDETPSRLTSYVDAQTGAVLRREEHVETVDGSGSSLYSGTVPLQVTKSGSTYQLKDGTRGGTYTTDMKNTTDSYLCQVLGSGCTTGTLFTSPTTSFGTGSTSSRTTVGVDAQYGTNLTWDYYNQVHGRNGIFGTGKGSFNRTHYGKNYVNAFWDGTKMTYGDGDGTNYGPLVSIDVTGHEMSHGVTENTAGLTYSGESGGLNEATSDIFGTMVEFYAANAKDPGDYLIGEQFDLTKHLGFRRMDNPSSDGSSQNCYTSGTKNLDVHYSSGVGNHFFYLLAEGSGAKTINGVAHNSPTCNGSTIAGIGRDAAQKIWYRALTVYMTSGTNYSGARTATLNAARDLYGTGSAQYNAVAAAWSAVSVA